MKINICTLLAATLLMIQSIAGAQAPGNPRQDELNETRKLLEEVLTARLTREFDLDDEATLKLVRGVSEHRDNMRRLNDERNRLLHELRQGLQRGTNETTAVNLANLLEIEAQLTAERLEFHHKMDQTLNPEQHARLYLFLHDFDQEMRRLIDRARQRGGEPGPAGGPRRAPESKGPRGETP